MLTLTGDAITPSFPWKKSLRLGVLFSLLFSSTVLFLDSSILSTLKLLSIHSWLGLETEALRFWEGLSIATAFFMLWLLISACLALGRSGEETKGDEDNLLPGKETQDEPTASIELLKEIRQCLLLFVDAINSSQGGACDPEMIKAAEKGDLLGFAQLMANYNLIHMRIDAEPHFGMTLLHRCLWCQ